MTQITPFFTGIYCYTYHLWEDHSKPLIRAIRLFYTAGLAIAPLVATFFLYRPLRTQDGKRLDLIVNDRIITMSPLLENSTAMRPLAVEVTSHVQYAYAIAGGFSVLLSVCFFCLTNTYDAHQEHMARRTSIVASHRHSSKMFSASSAHYSRRYSMFPSPEGKGELDLGVSTCHVLSVIFCFMAFTAAYGGLEVTFVGLLMTYNYNYLNMTKTTSLVMISVHACCRAVFSLFISFLVRYVRERTIMLVDMMALVLTCVFMFLTATPENPWTMWVCVVTIAFTGCNIYRMLLSWLGSHMKNLDSLPALFSSSFSVGVMILPYMTAHLLDAYGQAAYPAVLLTCSGICAVTLTNLYFLVWCKYSMPDGNQQITLLWQSHAQV